MTVDYHRKWPRKTVITPDTMLVTGMDERGQRFYVACTETGLVQFKASAYMPADGGMLTVMNLNDLSEETRLKVARVSDWPRIRRMGREWNFV